MISFGIIVLVFVSLLIYGIYEYQEHQKNVNKIPIRIHVNGTRGKSSVTRLIGAGLREAKINAITKVTGTFPRLILADGKETKIRRKAGANILEQLNIIKYAAQKKADALVIECMALQPIFQKITEEQMIRATIGVITNIRLDHLDVMGPTIREVGEALSETIPKNGILFTSEDKHIKFLQKKCQIKNAEFNRALSSSISDEDMQGFNYIEHKENVALAVDVCKHLGVDKETALKGMKKMIPDEGVLVKNTVIINDKRIYFYNAFAANDPESSVMIWNSISSTVKEAQLVFLLSIRHDRQSRAIQLITLASTLTCDLIVLIGETTDVIENKALSLGIPREKIVNKPWNTPEEIYNGLGEVVQENAVIVGIGNMGAMGAEVSQLFRKNQIKN